MKKEILLADDEIDIREILRLPLSDLGYQVYEAENGDQALRIFEERQPPIVLSDIKMPIMDGIELLQKIKRINPETEVIMITGHGDMDLAIRSLKNEATDFITKPINVDALEIALKRATEKILARQRLKEYTENLEKLIKEKIELKSHLSSLGLMIGSISHGIKGLMTGLDGGMYLLNSGISKNDQEITKEGFEVIKAIVGRIRSLVQDILFYSKERDLKCERIDTLSFADEVAVVIEQKLMNQNIEFVKDFDLRVGKCEVDASHLHSALINILENAVDACVRDKKDEPHKIIFSVRKDKKDIIFEVWDNGVGMDRETRDRIFTPFFSSKGEKGTGLGLFISKKIIEQHGGNITVKSTEGKGALFRIRIPKMLRKSANVINEKIKEEVSLKRTIMEKK